MREVSYGLRSSAVLTPMAQIAGLPAGSYLVSFEMNFIADALSDSINQIECIDPAVGMSSLTTVTVPGSTYSTIAMTEVVSVQASESITIACTFVDSNAIVYRGLMTAAAVGAVHS